MSVGLKLTKTLRIPVTANSIPLAQIISKSDEELKTMFSPCSIKFWQLLEGRSQWNRWVSEDLIDLVDLVIPSGAFSGHLGILLRDRNWTTIEINLEQQIAQWRNKNRFETSLLRQVVRKSFRPNMIGVDCTAGFFQDTSFFLSLGRSIIAYEQNPLLGLLINDQQPDGLEQVHYHAFTMDTYQANGKVKGKSYWYYIDPMFPERKQKTSNKKMEFLKLCAPVSEGSETNWGEIIHTRRDGDIFAVKRSLKDPLLADRPSFSIKGKTVRYDVYH
jgi:hypothetical protein